MWRSSFSRRRKTPSRVHCSPARHAVAERGQHMNGRTIGSIGLTWLAILTSAPAARADDLSGRPRMTRPQAVAYLQANGIEASPESLSQQIITGGLEAVDALVAAGIDVRARTSL